MAAAITIGTGLVLARQIGKPAPITVKIGFAAVGLSWFVISAFGSLPFILTGSIDTVTNAYFETASGFTTTGATILPDPSVLPQCLLFWRAATHWLGGMGVIVLSVAVLPLLGTGGVQLARAESTGHMPDRLTPRFRDTAQTTLAVVCRSDRRPVDAPMGRGDGPLRGGDPHVLDRLHRGVRDQAPTRSQDSPPIRSG